MLKVKKTRFSFKHVKIKMKNHHNLKKQKQTLQSERLTSLPFTASFHVLQLSLELITSEIISDLSPLVWKADRKPRFMFSAKTVSPSVGQMSLMRPSWKEKCRE